MTTPPEAAAPSASASAAPDTTPTPAATDTTTPPEAGSESVAAASEDDDSNTVEKPGKSYQFVGLRYRGTIVPSFIEHLFVDDGATIYSNTIGAEMDFRKDGKSTILWLQYTEFGFGDTLFLQKGVTDTPNNYSIVQSSLKGIYLGVDENWSTPLANHFDLEYGFGLGLGAIFGTLYNNWVYPTPGGAPPPDTVTADNGTRYSACQSVNDGTSCQPGDHQNATVAKVGHHSESNWFNGGAVPVVFPHVGGQIGVRWKPIKQVESRLQLGISLTGFWFGLSADYGLEQTNHGDAHKDDKAPAKPPSKDEDHPSSADKTSLEVGQRDTL
ncbi:MAG TPA: hypothetical protein VHV30_16275 [Polyangiaceae bacterium]|nr:hypothetical protein [Polyangiaceae bacterium]